MCLNERIIMKKEDLNKLNRCLSTIKIKEYNDLSTDKEYFDLYDICRKYVPDEKWEYPRIKDLSPFPFKAIEELTELIKKKISKGNIPEDCFDDITMLSILFSHLSFDAEEEYHYSDFDWLITKTNDLRDKDKIKVLNTVFRIRNNDMSKEQYLTLSNVLCLIVL